MKLTLCKIFGVGGKRKQQIKEFPTHRVLKKKTITFQTILYVWDKEKKVFMKKSNQNLVLKKLQTYLNVNKLGEKLERLSA